MRTDLRDRARWWRAGHVGRAPGDERWGGGGGGGGSGTTIEVELNAEALTGTTKIAIGGTTGWKGDVWDPPACPTSWPARSSAVSPATRCRRRRPARWSRSSRRRSRSRPARRCGSLRRTQPTTPASSPASCGDRPAVVVAAVVVAAVVDRHRSRPGSRPTRARWCFRTSSTARAWTRRSGLATSTGGARPTRTTRATTSSTTKLESSCLKCGSRSTRTATRSGDTGSRATSSRSATGSSRRR